MLFNSATFFWFLLASLTVYYLIPGRHTGARTGFLLIASYSFYLHWELWYFFLLFPVTLVNYACGIALTRCAPAHRKAVLLSAVGLSLGVLGAFKYTDFFLRSAADLAALAGFDISFEPVIDALPVGISFFTFQAMSYSLDVYRGRITPETHFARFALFVAFFPQLVAGPIEKAHNLLTQLREKLRDARPLEPLAACEQIAFGLFKKVAVADNIGPLIAPVFAAPEQYSGADVTLAAMLFSIQIYCDFSGYTDIAIGTARLFGIRLQLNFDYPYFAANITEFWRRWHISLSSWLKEYLYISLGGNRHGPARMYIALMLTMLLGGLWHGPSWNFVIWGGCHGLYLVVHKQFHKLAWRPTSRLLAAAWRVPATALTFILVTLTWIPFVCADLQATRASFSRIVSWAEGDKLITPESLTVVMLMGAVLLIADSLRFAHTRLSEAPSVRETPIAPAWVLIPAVVLWLQLSTLFAAPEGQQFIYFAF